MQKYPLRGVSPRNLLQKSGIEKAKPEQPALGEITGPNEQPTMFPTPTETDVSTESQTAEAEAEAEAEEMSVYEQLSDDIVAQYQDYWAVVETYRAVKKLVITHHFDGKADGVSNADIAALKEDSHLADHFVFYKDHKNQMKAEFEQLRKDDEIPTEISLPGFKDEFEPDFEFTVLSADNAAESGVSETSFYENEDEIMVPDEYEAPTDEDGNLKIWKETEDGEFSLRQVLEIADNTDGIGKKTLAALEANLEEAR